VDEFGPLNLQPRPGRQWAAVSGKGKNPGREPRPRMRATYTRTEACGTCSPPMSRDCLHADEFFVVNRIEAQFTALRYFADGTDHATHKEQASMIRRYIIWRNTHAYDERLRRVVDRANVA